ncbi:MAG: SBBP repeat-containing protein [Candidatus Hodarchaeota archaeon]
MKTRRKLFLSGLLVVLFINMGLISLITTAQETDDEWLPPLELGDYIYSSFFGGANVEQGEDIVVDSQGNFIISGITWGSNFPLLNPLQAAYGGGASDAFLAKFNTTGHLLWSTFFGGDGLEFEPRITVDSSDNIIITGITNSTDLPTTSDAYRSDFDGIGIGYLARLASNGSLLYLSYYGGTAVDYPLDIDLDSSGNVLITGFSNSTDFPITQDADQATLSGEFDTFIIKFASNLSSVLYSTFLGGSFEDVPEKAVIDTQNNYIVCGWTESSDFPVTPNAYQNTNHGSADMFVAKYDEFGNLNYATYFGGSDYDYSGGIAVDSAGNIIVGGNTWSTDFPITTNAYQATHAGISDAVLVKFINTGEDLVFSTYLGKSGWDGIFALDIYTNDSIIVAGNTNSTDFPILNGFQTSNIGLFEVFITQFSPGGLLSFSTYLGGYQWEIPQDIDVFNDYVYLVGTTASRDFFVTDDAYQYQYESFRLESWVFRFDLVNYVVAVEARNSQTTTSATPIFELSVIVAGFSIPLFRKLRKRQKAT